MKYFIVFLLFISTNLEAKTYRCKINGKYVYTTTYCHDECNVSGERTYSKDACSQGKKYEDSADAVRERDIVIESRSRELNENSDIYGKKKKVESEFYDKINGKFTPIPIKENESRTLKEE